MTNGLVQHIKVEESTSIQWVNNVDNMRFGDKYLTFQKKITLD